MTMIAPFQWVTGYLSMKIQPENLVISEAKLSQYLLIGRAKNDKSKYLAQAGFTIENQNLLDEALHKQAENDAVLDRIDEYGEHYQISGILICPNGVELDVITIWNKNASETTYRFVTLKPRRLG